MIQAGDGTSGGPWSGMAWTARPARWEATAAGALHAGAAPGSDFWRRTFYGFERDTGHAFTRPATGDFTATLTFEANYRALYDQAGLVLRAGPARWIKFGVELTDGRAHLSAVVTDGASDWSAQPLDLAGPLTVRATRLGGAVLLQHGSDAAGWRMARLAPFAEGEVAVGPYLCAPERRAGDEPFEARFLGFDVAPPRVRSLHA